MTVRFINAVLTLLAVSGIALLCDAQDGVAQSQPTGVYTSFFGGSGDDRIHSAERTADNAVIIVGATTSPNLPGTAETIRNQDAFVSKIIMPEDSTEKGSVLWTVLLGGSGYDSAQDVAVAADGRIYVVGTLEQSDDFTEINSLYKGGKQDCFLAILDGEGNVLTASRIGGSDWDTNPSLALGPDGDVYITCESLSGDFPSGETGGSLSVWRTVVLRLRATDNALSEMMAFVWSASENVTSAGIDVDDEGRIYLAGHTTADDLALKDAAQSVFHGANGANDLYVAVFDSAGKLETSTYWGGSGFEIVDDILVDEDGIVHVWGGTTSQDFPVVNAFQEAYGGGRRDGFAVVFAPLAKTVLGSSYVGGSAFDEVGAFARDGQDNLIYAGRSLSDDFLPQGSGGGTLQIQVQQQPEETGYVFSPWRIAEAGMVLIEIAEVSRVINRRIMRKTGSRAEAEVTHLWVLLKAREELLYLFATIWFGGVETTTNAAQPENPNSANAINVGAVAVVSVPDMTTAVHSDESLPGKFTLYSNYPNPFNPETTLRYELPQKAEVRLVIYDVAGRFVRTLVSELQPAGSHMVTWDGRDAKGQELASGVYVARFSAGKFTDTVKMLLVK